jgi:hypothetical protein
MWRPSEAEARGRPPSLALGSDGKVAQDGYFAALLTLLVQLSGLRRRAVCGFICRSSSELHGMQIRTRTCSGSHQGHAKSMR